jgi:predicted P-loop ATPase
MTDKKNTPNSQGKAPKPNGGGESDDFDLGPLNDEIEIELVAGSSNTTSNGSQPGGLSGRVGGSIAGITRGGTGAGVGGRKAPRTQRNMHTLLSWIAADPGWRYRVRYNEFANRIEVKLPFPPHDAGAVLGFATPVARGDWRALDDAALRETVAYFQGSAGFGWATKALVMDALAFTAKRTPFHPVRECLEGLAPIEFAETLELLERFFLDYFPCQETARNRRYLRRIGPCFLVSMIARIYEPGAKVDHIPVLDGPTGFQKSEGWRALVPDPDWFSDDLALSLVDRDTKESLRGKWLIEMSEMPHLARAVETVKAFISRRVDRYRVAYGMLSQDHPRMCVFVGTSNSLELVDVTGNRRFWPLSLIAPVRLDLIRRDRDKLFAAALTLYRHRFQWWLPPDIEEIAADVQADFLREDSWATVIEAWIGKRERPSEPFTLQEVLKALGLTESRDCSAAATQRAARVLRSLGYRRGERETVNGERVRFWRLHRIPG